MDNKTISVSLWTAASIMSWLTTAGFITLGSLTNSLDIIAIGLAMSAVSATLSIRCYCVRLGSCIQNAFDLGRDVGRSEVVQIRR